MSSQCWELVPFTPTDYPRKVSAAVAQLPGSLVCIWRMEGTLGVLGLKQAQELGLQVGASKSNESLWKHTCFEIFCRPSAQQQRYQEWNFSASGLFNQYEFSSYRKLVTRGARSGPEPVVGLLVMAQENWVEVVAQFPCSVNSVWVSPTLVVKTEKGHEYWAIRHCGAAPDFHHPASFDTLG